MELLDGLKNEVNISQFSQEYSEQNKGKIKKAKNINNSCSLGDIDNKSFLSSNMKKEITDEDNKCIKQKDTNISSILEKISLLSKELIKRKHENEKLIKDIEEFKKENVLLKEDNLCLKKKNIEIVKEVYFIREMK